MFGKKKTTTAAAPKLLSETTNTDESVHVFDQTNGVLKQFETYTTEGHPGESDYEDTSRVITGGVIAGQMGGGFGQ